MPELFHTIQIPMLDHRQKWIILIMKTHGQLNKYNAIRLSVPAYNDLTPKNESYVERPEWNGKEMKEMTLYLLGVVTQSQRGGSPTQDSIFNYASVYTQALVEFNMYVRYTSHDAKLSYMWDAGHCLHTVTDVFLLG
jgi:hypothetical protein